MLVEKINIFQDNILILSYVWTSTFDLHDYDWLELSNQYNYHPSRSRVLWYSNSHPKQIKFTNLILINSIVFDHWRSTIDESPSPSLFIFVLICIMFIRFDYAVPTSRRPLQQWISLFLGLVVCRFLFIMFLCWFFNIYFA